MGFIAHNAIVCTGWHDASVKAAYKKAKEIFPTVSPILNSGTNAYKSFFIPPDGSKEGWITSEEGDNRRYEFKTWLIQRYKETDGGFYLDWVEIEYGGDLELAQVVADNSLT